MIVKCLNPGCAEQVFFIVKPLYELRRVFVWWLFWRGIHLRHVHVGWAAICAHCDTSANVTHEETTPTVVTAARQTLRTQTQANGAAAEERPRPVSLRP